MRLKKVRLRAHKRICDAIYFQRRLAKRKNEFDSGMRRRCSDTTFFSDFLQNNFSFGENYILRVIGLLCYGGLLSYYNGRMGDT